MRLCSRGLFLGILFVLFLAICACQPVQPIPRTPAPTAEDESIQSDALDDTATLTGTTSVLSGIEMTAAEGITATGTTILPGTDSVQSDDAVTAPGELAAIADPAQLAAGLAVYRAQYCGVCHMLDAAETRGTFGPTHNGMGQLAVEHLQDVNYRGAATNAAEYIRESIVEPQAYIVPGYAATSHRMPSYAHLDAASLEALVLFLLAQ